MENKEIFKTEFEYTWDEYKKMQMHNPIIYFGNAFAISIIEIFIILIVSIILKLDVDLILFIDVIFLNLIIYKVKLESIIKKYYDIHKNKKILPKEIVTLFYDNYLIRKSDMRELKIEYKNIKKIIETNTNFYLKSKKNIMIPISKIDLKNDNEEFIRNINSKIYKNKLKKSKVVQKEKLKYVSHILAVLLILSILCFFLSIVIFDLIFKNVPSTFKDEKMYTYLLWIPIPLLSFLVGFKYEREVKFAVYNIIVGAIVSTFLFMFSITGIVFPIGRVKYNVIKTYEDVLNIQIPSDGDFIQNGHKGLDEQYYLITEAYFKNEKARKKIELNITKDNNWLEFNEMAVKEFDELIPKYIYDEIGECNYILIYNDTTGKYNEILENVDEYKIVVALYCKNKNHLKIYEYKFK